MTIFESMLSFTFKYHFLYNANKSLVKKPHQLAFCLILGNMCPVLNLLVQKTFSTLPPLTTTLPPLLICLDADIAVTRHHRYPCSVFAVGVLSRHHLCLCLTAAHRHQTHRDRTPSPLAFDHGTRTYLVSPLLF